MAADFNKLREALGMPEGTSDQDVLDKVAERMASMKAKEGDTAAEKEKEKEEETAAIAASLATHGFSLENGKVVKLSTEGRADLEIREGDDAEVIRLKTKLKAEMGTNNITTAKEAQELAAGFVKAGKIPPAAKDAITQLLSMRGESTAMMLATDGKSVTEKVAKVGGLLETVLKSLPKISGEQLKQLATMEGGDKSGANSGTTGDENQEEKDLELAMEKQKKDKARHLELASRVDVNLEAPK